ncbi:MAG: LamG domain-containing protein [Verrucomicrobiae bacterium]|nr:LamG domain-containing protein [Verrucomicrobiae bacterium]
MRAQEPLFHAPFDNSFTAHTVSGDLEPAAKQGPYIFEKGAFGNALKVGAPDSYLLYTAGSGLHGEEGTVSLWIQPEWTADDGKFHMLWMFLGDGVFNLYKFGGGENKLNFLVTGRGQPRDQFVIVSTSIATWEAGGPHHLAATWQAGLLQLFVDGERVGELSDPKLLLPDVRPGDALFIGDYYHPGYGTQAGLSGNADTLIRDFRLYGKALTTAQIAELAGVK